MCSRKMDQPDDFGPRRFSGLGIMQSYSQSGNMASLIDLPSNCLWSAGNAKGVGWCAMGKTFKNLVTEGTSCIFSNSKIRTSGEKYISKDKYYLPTCI